MSIQRWYANDEMTADDSGGWIRYDDHVAALAEATRQRVDVGMVFGYEAGLEEAQRPRTLTADDPEPAVGSVVLDAFGEAWMRYGPGWYRTGSPSRHTWGHITEGILIHDGGQ